MKLLLQEGESPNELDWESWGVILHGEILDDRGRCVLHEISAKATLKKKVLYLSDKLEVTIESDTISVDGLVDALRPLANGRILLEATTLGLAEIVLCCKAFRSLGIKVFDIVYVEPKVYHSPRSRHLLHKRDFDLSREVPGYAGIPGCALLLGDRNPVRSVFLLGYEEARLRRAFEELQMMSPSKASVTFGVPAFKSGWEMNAIANNIGVIREQNIRGGVHFCAAENPLAVIELLTEIYDGLENGERLVIAPIGTKPHGIGAALFTAAHEKVGLIYDHPKGTLGRSSDTGHWHLFTVESFV